MPAGQHGTDLEPVRLRALGRPVRIRCTGAAAGRLRSAVATAWSWCTDPDPDRGDNPGSATTLTAHLDDVGDLDVALQQLATDLTVAAIDACDRSVLLVHAVGLADPVDGRTAVLAAGSGTGKSTVARTLGRELGYLSDETVGIRPDRTVLAFPRPVLLTADPRSPVKTSLPPAAVGLRRVEPGRVAVIGVLQRDPALGGPPQVTRLGLLEGIIALGPQISHLAEMPRPLHALAEQLRVVGGVRRIRYAEAATLAPVVHRLLQEHRKPGGHELSPEHEREQAEPQVSPPTARPGSGGPAERRQVARGELVDWLVDGSESIALLPDQLVWLTAIPTAVVAAAARQPTVADLERVLVERFGPPGAPPREAVLRVVDDLVARGLLRWVPAPDDPPARPRPAAGDRR